MRPLPRLKNILQNAGCSLLVWLFSSLLSQAQTVIADLNFAAAIRATCPTCIDAANRILPPAASLTLLNVSNKNITNLSGIQSFTGLRELNCAINQLTSLPTLPSRLQILNCDSNKITSLVSLPSGLRELSCGGNQLTSLPALPSEVLFLRCSNNQLTSLPALTNGLQLLNCSNNQLTSLPALPSLLQFLYCFNNQIYCLTIIPNSLYDLRIDEDKVICLPNNPKGLRLFGRNGNPITLSVCLGMTISANNTSNVCSGSSVVLLASNCREIVRWSNGQIGNSITINPTATVTYTAACINVCDPNGINKSNAVTVTVLPATPLPSISGNNAFCSNNSTQLTVSNANNYTQFRWQRDGQNVGTNSSSLNVSEIGNYTVEASANGCSAISKGFQVQKSQPTVGNIKGGNEFCTGSGLSLTTEASGGVGAYRYEWLRNGQKVAEGNSYVVNTPGNYSTRVTDGIGCTAQFPTEVVVKENPRPLATLPTIRSLTGTETEAIKAAVSGGTPPYVYNWSSEPNVAFANGSSDAPTFGPFAQTTQIKLRISDSKGCQSDEIRTPITYIPCTISAGIQSQSFFFCKGSLPLVSNVQNGNDGYAYQWRKDNAPVGGNTPTLDATEGGQYSITISDKKGCRSTSGTVLVTKGNPSVQITGRLEFCAGNSTVLRTNTQNAKAPISYKWMEGSTTDSLRVTTVGKYTVEITDAQGCSATSGAITVGQLPLPVANAGAGKSVTCAETYSLAGVSTASGGAGNYQYNWSAQPAVPISNSTAAAPAMGPFETTTVVSLRLTDAKGCVGTAQSTITYISPDLNVILTGPNEFCSGKSIVLKTTVEKANLPLKQLVWYNGMQELKRDVNEWTTTQKGDYTVFVEDSKGCRKTSTAFKVAENPKPTVSIAGPTFFCYGNNAILTANVQSGTPPFKFQWKQNNTNTGPDNASLTAITEGSYVVGLTDSKGCTAEAATWSLTEKGAEIVATIQTQGPTTVYFPETVVLTATLGREYQYQWNRNAQNIAGATGASYEATQSGSYSVVISRGDCRRESATTVVRIDIPLANNMLTKEEIKIYPNPATEKIQISCKAAISKNSDVSLYDLSGKLLQQQPLKEEMEIDVSNYKIGNYLIKIQTERGCFSTLINKQN